MKVVIDTNVVVDHFWAEDEIASAAIVLVKKSGHEIVVCEKLLQEYRGVLSRGPGAGGKTSPALPQFYWLIDNQLRQMLPRMREYPDPTVRIGFGPPKDRFHMQLAIDRKAVYHVSKDAEVLAAAGDLMIASNGRVKGCHPREFVRICGGS